MPYEVETVKVEFEGGHYAILAAEMLHGTARRVERVTRKYLKFPEGAAKLKVRQGGDDNPQITPPGEIDIDLTEVDFTEGNDEIILGQVKSWSFGEVSREILDTIPEEVYSKLVAKCDELFGKGNLIPLAKSGGKN